MHIGFLARDFLKWGGGVWFLQNLLRGLAATAERDVRISVLVPTDSARSLRVMRALRAAKRAVRAPTRIGAQRRERSKELALWRHGVAQLSAVLPEPTYFDGTDADLRQHCRAAAIDVVLPAMMPPDLGGLPWVGYLYDCQHRHYPQFFSSAEIVARDRAFEAMLGAASTVFANARAVVDDLDTFFPNHRAALFALPFAPLISDDDLAAAFGDAAGTQARYGTGARYFVVANQFWVHKDHATAFRAFARFIGEPGRDDFRLVCTGLTDDYRVPGHFAMLQALLAELGIAERVVFTGYIDRHDQLRLMRGAVALLQPTLFEGGPGGGAVADAISLGVRCAVSDIGVNRELDDPLATFFAVGDAPALAVAMARLTAPPLPQAADIETLRERSRRHAATLGAALLALADHACSRGCRPS